MNLASGEVVSETYRRHRHREVMKWLARQKRIFLHFIPTSSSWLNLVEGFFAKLKAAHQAQCIHFGGSSGSLPEGMRGKPQQVSKTVRVDQVRG